MSHKADRKYLLVWLFFMLLSSGISRADSVRVAVASNFASTLKEIAVGFKNKTSDQLLVSSASSGKLYAQIIHGAPYDIFLSADARRAELLVEKSHAVHPAVYARGQLSFIARDKQGFGCHSQLNEVLAKDSTKKIAIANPKIAPYGLAAKQFLEKKHKWKSVRSRLIMGENILQAFQFVTSGNVEAGFVASSLALNVSANTLEKNNYCQWPVPAHYYAPIRQKMVILRNSADKLAVKKFYHYMQSAEVKRIMKKNGYLF